MSRYVERMDNTARLLDAGRRLDALPRQHGATLSEWTSIVIASGCTDSFPGGPETATSNTVREHLVRDETNPSSIVSCILAARQNAKAVRPSLTSEVWEAINQTQSELKKHLSNEFDRNNLNAFFDWVQGRAALIVGSVLGTMMRDDRHGFVQIGKWFERADATARLLDVKYHMLLPKVADVGSGLDYRQCLQIMRAAKSATAFRHVYGRSPEAEGVVDLLVLNPRSPRSLRTALDQLCIEMTALVRGNAGLQQDLLRKITTQAQAIDQMELADFFSYGLHKWLKNFIIETNDLAGMTVDTFGFGVVPVPQAS